MRALVDISAAGGLDLSRLERSLGLHVQPAGRGRYRVSGGDEPHWVDLHTLNQPRCDCGDHIWRESVCKHILAALLREGDERVLRAIGVLVTELREGAKAA
jgi:hypothetical protein